MKRSDMHPTHVPKRGRFELVYLCAGLYVTNGRSDRQFSIVIRIGSAPITCAAAGGLMGRPDGVLARCSDGHLGAGEGCLHCPVGQEGGVGGCPRETARNVVTFKGLPAAGCRSIRSGGKPGGGQASSWMQ